MLFLIWKIIFFNIWLLEALPKVAPDHSFNHLQRVLSYMLVAPPAD